MSHEQRLREERQAATAQLQDLERSLRSIIEAAEEGTHDDEHDPDGSTIAFERAQTLALIASTQRQLSDLDDALDRVTAETYGRCAVCGNEIPTERLESLPATRLCVSCSQSAANKG